MWFELLQSANLVFLWLVSKILHQEEDLELKIGHLVLTLFLLRVARACVDLHSVALLAESMACLVLEGLEVIYV